MAGAQKSNRRRERVGSQSHFQLPDLGESQRPAETLAQLGGGKGLLSAVTSLLTHVQVCSVNFEITLFLRTCLGYIQVSQDGFKTHIPTHFPPRQRESTIEPNAVWLGTFSNTSLPGG